VPRYAYARTLRGTPPNWRNEGANETDKIGLDFFELARENNHYKLIKNLVDSGAAIKGIEKKNNLERSKYLFEEYSKSFIPEIKDIHEPS